MTEMVFKWSYLLVLCFLIDPVIGQIPTFTNEDTLIIIWNPSSSTDVEFYTAYFAETDTLWNEWKELRQIKIITWNVESDTCSYLYVVPLFSSHWLLFMTATDSSENESIPSEQVKFIIVDGKPLPPYYIRIIG